MKHTQAWLGPDAQPPNIIVGSQFVRGHVNRERVRHHLIQGGRISETPLYSSGMGEAWGGAGPEKLISKIEHWYFGSDLKLPINLLQGARAARPVFQLLSAAPNRRSATKAEPDQ